MKNYNEIANDLFERRDKCIAEQKSKKKNYYTYNHFGLLVYTRGVARHRRMAIRIV